MEIVWLDGTGNRNIVINCCAHPNDGGWKKNGEEVLLFADRLDNKQIYY